MTRVRRDTAHPSLEDKYLAPDGLHFMTGIQALVRLPMEQHRRDRAAGLDTATFISGYQGSPLGTYDLELGRNKSKLDEHQIVFQPGVNEELAATAVMGTQVIDAVGKQRYDGVCGIWYGKSPGVDRASDALRHANVIGVPATGGAIAVAGDDPIAKSSSLPCTSEAALFDMGIPFLFPKDVQEVLDFGIHAFAMSRCSGLWAGMKIVTNVADGSATVDVGDERLGPQTVELMDGDSPLEHRPSMRLFGPNTAELERTMRGARIDAARRYIALNQLNCIANDAPRAEVGIVAPGKSYVDVLEALHRLGLDGDSIAAAGIRLLKIGAPYPLDPAIVRQFSDGLREIIVIEEKRAFVELFVKEALYGSANQPLVVGKHDDHGAAFMPANHEGSPELIVRLLGSRLPGLDPEDIQRASGQTREVQRLNAPTSQALARTPYFCSGCPHNTSRKVPEGAIVGAGIGCSGLTMLMDEEDVGKVTGTTQMGGEGAQWIGMSHFTEVPHIFQNIGDGTFMHSGSLAIRAAVASGVNITYKLLFNSAVAMTGGQRPVGAMDAPTLVQSLITEGVRKIIVTTDDLDRYRKVKLPRGVEVYDRSRLLAAEETLSKVPGVTVLLHDQECAAEQRRKRKRGKLEDPPTRIFINERVCEGCGDCGEKSNCLSVEPVETEFGRKTKINQTSCNKDYTCLNGDCPSFLEVIPGGRKSTAKGASLGPDDIEPPPASDRADFSIRITGIGGTGVVTVAQVIATAASLDGWFVRGLDQTGMAQKGGPVVSDLRFTSADGPRTNKLASVDCDLYLGCDILVAASEGNLTAADPGNTVGVVSSAIAPTGNMVIDKDLHFPPLASLKERIEQRMRPKGLQVIDSRSLTAALLGSSQTENMLLVGAAYQAGALPVSAESVERAIQLNGVAVDANLQAFRRGRQAVADPKGLTAAADAGRREPRPRATGQRRAEAVIASVNAVPGSELHRLLTVRVPELVAYQNRRYAARYADVVERIRSRESELVPDGNGELATAVARNLFKLMAYKDEAEVARLNIDGELRADLEAEFGPGARYAWKLHPPVFRALGLKRKITLGRWFTPVFHVLYAMRHLRGTPFYPFGYGKVRRVERELIDEYIAVLGETEAQLCGESHSTAVAIAELPDMVRGYEEIKLRNVDSYHERLAELRSRLRGQPAQALSAAT